MEKQKKCKRCFNKKKALNYIDGDTELFKEIVDLFLECTPKCMEKIQQAIKCGDSITLESAARVLCDSAGNFDAKAVVKATSKLEKIGRKGNLIHAPKAFTTLKKEIELLIPVLITCVNEMVS